MARCAHRCISQNERPVVTYAEERDELWPGKLPNSRAWKRAARACTFVEPCFAGFAKTAATLCSKMPVKAVTTKS